MLLAVSVWSLSNATFGDEDGWYRTTTSCSFPCSTRRASDSLDSLVTVFWDFHLGSGADWRERSPQKSAVAALLGSRGSACAGSTRIGHYKRLWHSRGTTECTLCSPTERSLATFFVPPKTPAARWVCATVRSQLAGIGQHMQVWCVAGRNDSWPVNWTYQRYKSAWNSAVRTGWFITVPGNHDCITNRECSCMCVGSDQTANNRGLPGPLPHATIDITTQPERCICSRFLCSYATEAPAAVSATPTSTSITALW